MHQWLFTYSCLNLDKVLYMPVKVQHFQPIDVNRREMAWRTQGIRKDETKWEVHLSIYPR